MEGFSFSKGMFKSHTWFITSLLNGVGQVIFQENPLTGFFILVGIGFSGIVPLLLGLFALFIATLFAWLIRCPKEQIGKGLFGFNAFLVGLGVSTFFAKGFEAYIALFIGSILSVVIPYLLQKKLSFSLYTAPFILLLWIMLLLPDSILPRVAESTLSFREVTPDFPNIIFQGFSQVFLQGGSLRIGAFILIGLIASSLMQSFWGMLGVLFPLFFFFFLEQDYSTLNAGLWGYNGVLVAIAVGGNSFKSILWVLYGLAWALFFQFIGIYWGITTLTAPFVGATWLVLGTQWGVNKLFKKNNGTSSFEKTSGENSQKPREI